jgi:hypothetical protein
MQRSIRQHKPAGVADGLLAAGEPLDEHEQQAVIQQLQEEQLAQNRQFKLVFGTGAVLVAAFFAWAGWQQHAHPWEQRFTGELRTVTGQHTVTTVLFLQALSMAWAASALFTDLPQKGDRVRGCSAAGLATQAQLTASVACAATGALYWGHAMYANIQLHGPQLGAVWDLLWLPLGPLTYSCLCAYVVTMVSNTGKEVRELQRLSYQYKKV